MMNVETIAWGGWDTCYRLSDDTLEMIITAEVGPRVIAYNLIGKENMFFNMADDIGKTGGDKHRIYGGHRLWHAPEDPVRTYQPENAPVDVTVDEGRLTFTPAPETATGLQKALTIVHDGHPDARPGEIAVEHRLTNVGLWPIECGAWGLSMMASGGVAVLPLPPRAPHHEVLIPTGQLALWAYTDLSDPRWTFGHEYILLQQDPEVVSPQKIGALTPAGWLAYVRDETMLFKRFSQDTSATYPDNNSNVELFTNNYFLELETLSPLVQIQPGQTIVHTEFWSMHQNVAAPQNDEDVKKHILTRL